MYGTLSVSDLLATQRTIFDLGEDLVWQSIQAALNYHNNLVGEKLGTLVDVTTDRFRRYGGPASMTMERIGQFGRPDAQKIIAGTNVFFPLYSNQISVQWTRKYFLNMTVQELANQFVGATVADLKRLNADIQTALFTPTNATVIDRLVDNASLDIKSLVNADGAPIPTSPGGVDFDGATHSHYLANATLDAATLTALIETVVEHYGTGMAYVAINRAQETAVRGLTGFIAYQPVQIVQTTAANTARGNLDTTTLNNRSIGIFGNQAAEVWVKPWVPAGYLCCYLVGSGSKPLVMRIRRPGEGLSIVAEDESYPLRCRTLEREAGVSVWERTAASVLYIGGATYVTPAFAA